MITSRFDYVSVEKVANVYYEGRCFSRAVWFEDGCQKMLGIILPCDEIFTEYVFETTSSERVEIFAGECEVRIIEIDRDETKMYRAGQSFIVKGHSTYLIRNTQVVQYISHFNG